MRVSGDTCWNFWLAELISIQIINIIQSDLNSSLYFLSYRKCYVVIILCVIGETETELFYAPLQALHQFRLLEGYWWAFWDNRRVSWPQMRLLSWKTGYFSGLCRITPYLFIDLLRLNRGTWRGWIAALRPTDEVEQDQVLSPALWSQQL